MLRKLSVCAAILLLLVTPVSAEELSLKTIIDRVVEANGGEAALRNIKTLKTVGTLRIEGVPGASNFTIWNAEPNKMRFESKSKAFLWNMYCDGRRAWVAVGPANAALEPQELTGANALATIRSSVMNLIFLDFEKNGLKLSLLPGKDLNGRSSHIVNYEYKDGQWMKVYYDAETYLPHLIEASNGSPYEMSDFRVVEGVPFPYLRKMTASNGSPMEMRVTEIILNESVDEAVFTPSQ